METKNEENGDVVAAANAGEVPSAESLALFKGIHQSTDFTAAAAHEAFGKTARTPAADAGGQSEREKFEVWATQSGAHVTLSHVFSFTPHPNGGRYMEGTTELCWRAWQAAQAGRAPATSAGGQERIADLERQLTECMGVTAQWAASAGRAAAAVQEFKRDWQRVPYFANRVNKEVREAIATALSHIVNLDAVGGPLDIDRAAAKGAAGQ